MTSVELVLDGWALEVDAAREQGIENTIIALYNMYKYYKSIKAGQSHELTLQVVNLYGKYLDDFRSMRPPHWLMIKHPDVLPALQEAYTVVRYYALRSDAKRGNLRVIKGGQE